MDLSLLVEGAATLGLSLDEGRIAAFQAFGRSLYAVNEEVNLTRVPQDQCAVRHFLDSLLVSPWIPGGASVLDLGTGPGFPAWPLACARPDVHVTAVDSWRKGLEFLRRHPLPNLDVVEARAEELGRREEFDAVTGRAFAPFAVQAEASAPWVAVGGRFVPFRTPSEEGEVRSFPAGRLGLRLSECQFASLPGGAGERMFPLLLKFEATDPKYPRRWAEMKSRPLAP